MQNRRLVLVGAFCAAFGLFMSGPVLVSPAAVAGSTLRTAPSPTLEQVDGGPDYYARFSDPLPTNRSYFPIGVWYESVVSQADVDKDKDAGLNLYVVLTANSDLSLVGANGMHALLNAGEWGNSAAARDSRAVAGWELDDEIDMEQGPGAGYEALEGILASLPSDGRLRYNNYGKGVTFWETDAEAARFVNEFQDVVSADNYWFTDNNICSESEGGALLAGGTRALTAAECHRAANYGATVERVRSLVTPQGSKPVWTFVELGHPFTEGDWPTIEPAQVRAAVWQSLIAGARGIVYFNHSFGGPDQSQHVLRDPAYAPIRAAVRTTNQQIKRLAPVLNAPTLSSGWSHEAGTTATVKWANGHFYVLAGSAGSSVDGRFSIPCIGDAGATVLDEARTVPVRGGSFTDHFADGNAVHVYRIDGGSTCGLGASDRARVGRLPRRVNLRAGRLVVPVRCGADCKARSRLTTSRSGKPRKAPRPRLLLAAAKRRYDAGRHKLVLRLSKRARRRVARADDRLPARLRTVVVQSEGKGARRTQHLVIRR